MKWQEVTAIYLIGHQYPIATFAREECAVKWAEHNHAGEWIKKAVKIPHLPLASKSAQKNLKNVAAMLDNLDWEDDGLDPDAEDEIDKVVINPQQL